MITEGKKKFLKKRTIEMSPAGLKQNQNKRSSVGSVNEEASHTLHGIIGGVGESSVFSKDSN
jgi:hypothetical protein